MELEFFWSTSSLSDEVYFVQKVIGDLMREPSSRSSQKMGCEMNLHVPISMFFAPRLRYLAFIPSKTS
jgi:hypothetical protein